jgi:predicted membrane-bound mannosyltransferase/sugar lactone lactonase YvrE
VAEAALGRRVFAVPRLRADVREWALEHWDIIALAGLMAVAAALRFYDLGARALHHDESLHATFSWYLYDGQGYRHDPLMHGPFQFHIDALAFFLFGPSDYTARVPHAFFGTALVGLPYLLKRQIGVKAMLIAAVFFAFSPTLLYFSRFDREDAFDMFWTTAMVVCMWRYLDELKDGWLYALAGVTALSFATKETTFIEVAIILVFIDLMLAWDLARGAAGEARPLWQRLAYAAILAPVAWAVAALWPLIGARPFGRERLPPAGDVMVVIGTLALPQYAAGIQELENLRKLPVIGHTGLVESIADTFRNRGYDNLTTVKQNPRDGSLIVMTVTVLLVLSAYAGLLWKPRTWMTIAAFFYVPYVLLFTTGLTQQPMPWTSAFWHGHGGFFSGIWGSLDYWLDQQGVNRGNQPSYYYALLTPLYEFVPLLLGLAGSVWLVLKGNAFNRWLLFWLVGVFVGLSLAGEKMPWLEVYIAIPLALVAAVVLAKAMDVLQFSVRDWAFTAGLAAASVLAVILAVSFESSALNLAGYVLAAVVAGACVYVLGAQGVRAGARAALTVAVAMLMTFSVRAATMASFQHGDIPVEMLVYTQTSPDIPKLVDRIGALAKRSGLGYNLPIVVDATDGFSWPWAWYLRDYHDVQYPTVGQNYKPPPNAVLLIAQSNASYIDATGYDTQRYKHRWWFIEESYRGLTWSKLWRTLTTESRLENLLGFWVNRRSDSYTGSVDGVAYFPQSLANFDVAKPPEKPAPPPVKLDDGRIVIGKLGISRGEFNSPSDVAVDSRGNIWVADTNNNRIQEFDAEGNFVAALGGGGNAPGRFNQPWSLAVDSDGTLYVADTWNHRIQKLQVVTTDSGQALAPVAVWGEFYNGPNPGPFQMFGPRDIVIAPDGTLWVTDTGNKRLVNYTKDGQFIRSIGGPGAGPGQFNEEVSLAFDSSGGLLVADTWNGRIQRFSPDFSSSASFDVGWTNKDAANKPYLAVLGDGRIVAAEPAKGYLMLFDPAGTLLGTWKPADGARPVGVAARGDGGFVFSDAARNEVQVVPAGLISKLFH